MGRKQLLLFTVILFFLVSCNQNRVFEKYFAMETQAWNIDDTVSLVIGKDLEYAKTVLIFKYNNDYEYRNLYFRYILSDSLGNEVDSKLIDLPLFESTSGKPLGKGYGSTFTNYDTLPINNKIEFHQIHLLQYMRVDELKGIESIGIKLIKD